MAKTTATLYTTLNSKIVKDDLTIQAENVAHLLSKLADIYGKDFKEEIFDGAAVKNYYIILHNGNAIDREKPADVVLSDGDVVHIFPPVSGG